MQISKSVMSVGGLVLAAVVIGFTNPKAVHAVTAALVQVTNTATNPVVTQSVGQQAGNMVHLRCNVSMITDSSYTCQSLAPDGALSDTYSVPVGESLVITSVDLMPTGACAYDMYIYMATPNGHILQLTTTNSLATTHFTYTSGLVIGGGITPRLTGTGVTSTQDIVCNIVDIIDIYGYLTAS